MKRVSMPTTQEISNLYAADKEVIFWRQDSSAQQQKQHVLYRGWYYFVAAISQRLSISGDATRFPPTQPGAVALA